MPYNFAADSFYTQKKLCSRLSSSEVRFHTEIGRFAFLRPSLGDLAAIYDDHLRLIEKCVVDFVLVLLALFLIGVKGEALYERISIENRVFFATTGSVCFKISGRKARLPPTIIPVGKLVERIFYRV